MIGRLRTRADRPIQHGEHFAARLILTKPRVVELGGTGVGVTEHHADAIKCEAVLVEPAAERPPKTVWREVENPTPIARPPYPRLRLLWLHCRAITGSEERTIGIVEILLPQ